MSNSCPDSTRSICRNSAGRTIWPLEETVVFIKLRYRLTTGSVKLAETERRPDNGVVYVPTGYVNQAQLGDIITQAAEHLGPEVVHVGYSLGPDSTGEPSLFFRILLADAYIREDTIADLTGRIAGALFEATRPLENWGLRPYFNFRSKSEQDRRRDPNWE